MNAREANAVAQVAYELKCVKEFSSLMEEIELRAYQGKFSFTTGNVFFENKCKLEELGYTVITGLNTSNEVVTEILWRNV